MPLASLKPCPSRGCAVLTRGGPCANHARVQRQTREARRLPLAQRGWYHTALWKRLRLRFLSEHPVCACGQPANTVDHKVPHDMDYDKFFDWQNLRAMCAKCHSVKTATQDGGFGNRRVG